MTTILNRVRRSFYADSVALMRVSRVLSEQKGVEMASIMIGTPSNLAIFRDAGLLAADGEAATPNDLVIAVRGTIEAVQAALDQAELLLDSRSASMSNQGLRTAHSLDGAMALLPDANVALISVPGPFAYAEAARALERGLNVMIFSDNVPIEEEIALKRAAISRGLLVMGPDCGTSVIGGVPIAFANALPRGNVGIVSASGTGLQEVSCLLARSGRGLSHGIGVGGRDLKDEIGGLMTLAAIDVLDADPSTAHIVVISKPPSPAVTGKVLGRIGLSGKPFTLCLLGAGAIDLPANASLAANLQEAAEKSGGFAVASPVPEGLPRRKGAIRGLYTGGTLCSEAQLILLREGFAVSSNVPVPQGMELTSERVASHTIIDLGDDTYTQGRPHPMIDPELRSEQIAAALEDAATAVILIDVVIGYGAHADPASLVVEALERGGKSGVPVVASVTGTDADPQNYSRQVATLRSAGIFVAPSNAQAALWAARCASVR
jgi:FdrA protein